MLEYQKFRTHAHNGLDSWTEGFQYVLLFQQLKILMLIWKIIPKYQTTPNHM